MLKAEVFSCRPGICNHDAKSTDCIFMNNMKVLRRGRTRFGLMGKGGKDEWENFALQGGR
jgi:hypothetical protein